MGDTLKWGMHSVLQSFDPKRGFVHLTEVPEGYTDVKLVAGKDFAVVACAPDREPIVFSKLRHRWEYLNNGELYEIHRPGSD